MFKRGSYYKKKDNSNKLYYCDNVPEDVNYTTEICLIFVADNSVLSFVECSLIDYNDFIECNPEE